MDRFALMTICMLLGGCNSLSRLLPQYQKDQPASGSVVPEHLHGFTVSNQQVFAPFQTADRLVVVKVRRTGEDWHTCNPFEVYISTKGTGGVFLRNISYPMYDDKGNLVSLTLTGKPVAPIGTEYDIDSMS